MMIVVGIFGAFAVMSWLFAVVSYVACLRNLAPGVSVWRMLVRGTSLLDDDTLTERGRVHRGRFGWGVGGFFAFALLAAVASLLANPPA